jgi:hypothetical protein
MGAKLRNSCEKSKDRVNICKKKCKDLCGMEKMFIFAPITKPFSKQSQENGRVQHQIEGRRR